MYTANADAHTLPLEPPVYPREIVPRRRTPGFYAVLLVVGAVWVVTPLSYVYLAWYALSGRHIAGHASIPLTALAVWAAAEALFGIYYQYLARKVQRVSPPTDISPEALSDLFLRVLHAGLAYDVSTKSYARESTPVELEKVTVERSPRSALERAVERLGQTLSGGEAEDDKGREERGEAENDAVFERRPSANGAGRYTPAEGADRGALFDENGNPNRLDTDDPLAVEFREQLRTWFHHAPWDTIKQDDVLTWLAWSCFNMDLAAVRADTRKNRFLTRSLAMLEARTGTTFPPGRTGMRVIRLTLDPVNVESRPLFIYAISNGINWFLAHVYYPWNGMKLCREGDIDYFVRIPPGWTPEKGLKERNALPVVYLHGLGFGLLQNHLLIRHLVHSLPTHPLIVPLAHHTAQEIFNSRHLRPWTRPELVAMLRAACERWGFWAPGQDGRTGYGGVSMLSHSNGSVHHAWVLKDAPEMVRRTCFVDPVVFCLWEGDVAFSFCYRKPRSAIELALYYFIASEVGIANYIQRHFFWCDNTLFVEEIPNAREMTRSAFLLGGKDVIVDMHRVRRYLVRNGVTRGVHWNPDAGHGDGLLGAARDRVVKYVGTGTTKGWEEWLTRGRRSHSLGEHDRPLTPQVVSDSDNETTSKGPSRPSRQQLESWITSRDTPASGVQRRKR